jgi:hypothetical protein
MRQSSKSPDECARYLLTIFVKLQAKVGEPVPAHTLATLFAHPPWNTERLERATEFAVERGWLVRSGQDGLALTRSGWEMALG